MPLTDIRLSSTFPSTFQGRHVPRIPGIRRYTRTGRSADNIGRQVDDEIAFHFAMCVDELVSRGMTREQARAEAERRFGDVASVRSRLTRLDRERIREERHADWWSAIAQDARYAARGFRRSPAFTIGVIITLALGIGANAAVFTFIDRTLLRAPAYVSDADNLRRVNVEMTFKSGNTVVRAPMSFAEFDAIRQGTKAFDRIAAFRPPSPVALGRGVDAPRVKQSPVTGDFFRTLGVRPQIGRFFVVEDDDEAVSVPAAVLGYGLWERRFRKRADVIGQPLVLDGRPHVIVGVAPNGFSGAHLDAPDVWVPLIPTRRAESGTKWRQFKTSFNLQLIGHLAPGASAEQAAAQASVAVRPAYLGTFMATLPATVRLSSVIPGKRIDITESGISIATRVLGAAVMVLLIACANVANLLLARALARRRELAVRLALGIGRTRLVVQLLTESILLALVAGVAALLIALWGGSILRGLLTPGMTWVVGVVDARTVVFTAIVTMLVGVVAGVAPAFQMTRRDLAEALKSGTRDTSGGRSLVRSSLVVAQAAFTVILLVGAGLFVRSLVNATTMDVGFAFERTLLAEVKLAKGSVNPAERTGVFDALTSRVRSVPGVAMAATTTTAPYWVTSYQHLTIPGRDSLPPEIENAPIHAVGRDFLQTMGIRVTVGRALASEDDVGSSLVAVVNEVFARRAWPGETAVGKCIKIGADTSPCRSVVGVVASVALETFREPPRPQYYIPLAQAGAVDEGSRYVVVRVAEGADVRIVASAVRNGLKGARADIDYIDVRPFLDLAEPEVRPFRLGASLFSALGTLALLLAGVGLYAVISFGVARRTREIGVRAALGARAGDLVRLVLGEGVRVTIVGVVVGILLALALGRLVEALLFGASPRDPVVFATAAVALVTVATLASVIPAWRATRVDPMTALRDD
jgi:predicted permease